MTTASEELLARVIESGHLDEPTAEDGIVRGRAHLEAAGADVTVSIDPELDDDEAEVDAEELIENVARVLGVTEKRWRAIVGEAADDIEDAVGDAEVGEQRDLRDELEATSVVVFADAAVVSLIAPRQFPDSRIVIQLDSDLEVDNIEVVED
ncbi:cytochrome C5 [Microbacterium sp. 179-I 3D4 NHS]|uniref:cytochrome C5 n=1 Tax=Microbacterium sp. 179-I 3D4 NHS TaxID=3142381 RepID=UPI00399F49E6